MQPLEFIKDLAKDAKKAPKSNSYKQVSAELIEVEKDVTKSMLDYFLNNVILIFEGFLTLFQNFVPTIHVVYDSICHNLIKVMRRCLKASSLSGKYDKELTGTIIPCQDVKLQLSESELNIVQSTRTTELGEIKVCHSWHSIALLSHSHTYTDKVLPKQHTLARSWLPQTHKKGMENNSSCKFQPQLDASSVQDK